MSEKNALFHSFAMRLLFFVFILGVTYGCSKPEIYEGTISTFHFFAESNNNVPLYAVYLSEIEEKMFIIPREKLEKFGFGPLVDNPGPVKYKGNWVSISNIWFESKDRECLGKKVKIWAKSKDFFKNNDNTDVNNDFEVTKIEWIK